MAKASRAKAKTREPLYGEFDCLSKDEGQFAPQIGKLSVHRTFCKFQSSFSATQTKTMKQNKLNTVDARSKISMVLEDKREKRWSLQFVDNTEAFECLVKKWKLEIVDDESVDSESGGEGKGICGELS